MIPIQVSQPKILKDDKLLDIGFDGVFEDEGDIDVVSNDDTSATKVPLKKEEPTTRKSDSPLSKSAEDSVSGDAQPSPYFPLTPHETSSPESIKSSLLARHAQLSIYNQNLDQLAQLAQSANLARLAAAQATTAATAPTAPFVNPFLNPFLPRLASPIINPLLSIYPSLNHDSTSLYIRSREAINHLQKK